MSMLEDHSSYINVLESAQDMDVGLGEADLETSGGRGVKEKRVSTTDKSAKASKHVNINDEFMVMEVQSPSVDQTNAVKTSGGSYPPLPTHGTTLSRNTPGKGNVIDVFVLVESIRAISERFVNTACGFFLGKRVAYPVVANYVRNTWGKFGLVKSMLNSSTGLFSFQFSSTNDLNSMLENGPWNVLVWVKLHGILITTFREDGLSVIATKLGTPLMLDSYTSDMCLQSWGGSSYSRVMIELRADMELKDNIIVAMSKIIGEGYYTCNVHVEYEWKLPRCSCCQVFSHTQEECPKNIRLGVAKNLKKPSQTS
ncbi:integrase, catalytic region, zinc finger, CCHC-type containing protein [Tanacetum coccineum]